MLFNSNLTCVELKGIDILEALENSVSRYEEKDPRFLQISGVQFVSTPTGLRWKELLK